MVDVAGTEGPTIMGEGKRTEHAFEPIPLDMGQVPDAHRPVLAGTGQGPAIGRKRHRQDLVGMAVEPAQRAFLRNR